MFLGIVITRQTHRHTHTHKPTPVKTYSLAFARIINVHITVDGSRLYFMTNELAHTSFVGDGSTDEYRVNCSDMTNGDDV